MTLHGVVLNVHYVVDIFSVYLPYCATVGRLGAYKTSPNIYSMRFLLSLYMIK